MTFDEILHKRRSVRSYNDKSVPLETINELIKECILAPNAGNEQPWKFILVNSRATMKRMSDESKKNILARIAANPDDYANRYKGMLENDAINVFYNAPCLVLILGRANAKNLYVDCALAAGYFMMSATSRGLGTCWVNLGAEIEDPGMINELGIPGNYKIVAPIILGYPEKIPSISSRNEPEVLKIIT